MPTTNQWAVSVLIREVLADPDLAGRARPPPAPGPGRAGLIEVRGRRCDRREALRRAPTGAPVADPRRWPPPPGRWNWPSPSCAPGRSSPPCSTPAAGWTRPRCAVICSARGRGGAPSARPGDPVQGPGQRVGHQPLDGLADPRRASTRARASSSPVRWTTPGSSTSSSGATHLDVRVGRRVVCQALVVATGVSARGRREIPEHGPGGRRDHRLPGRPSCAPCANGGSRSPPPTIRRAWCWSPVTRTPVSGPRSRRSCPGPPGRRCRARFACNITTRVGFGPPPSRSMRWSRPSSPPPVPRR